jgi:hypothetical protein
VNFLWFYLIIPPRSWGLQEQPAALTNPYTMIDTQYRTMTLGYSMGNLPSLPGLGWGYPLLFGIPHLAGYEPLASADRYAIALGEIHTGSFKSEVGPVEWRHFENWAVRYFVVKDARQDLIHALEEHGFQELARAPGSILFENPRSSSLGMFDLDHGQTAAAKTQIEGNRLRVVTSQSKASRLKLAFVQDAFHSATIDGQRVRFESQPGQPIKIKIPAGPHEITIEYSNPILRQATAIALGGALLLILLLRWLKLENAEALHF